MSGVREQTNPRQRESFINDVELTAAEIALAAEPLLIPIPKAAQLLGISRSAAYRCAAAGDLPTTHLGGRVYIVTARLRELLESA
jgi:hypothetical protein